MVLNLLVFLLGLYSCWAYILLNGLIFLLCHTYSAQIIFNTLKSKRRRSRLSVCATVEGKFRRKKFCSVAKKFRFQISDR